jgi:outer membrane protein OmpA-like peptidoglycan-associated protein
MQKYGLGLMAVALLLSSCSGSASMKARVTTVEQRITQLEETTTQQQVATMEVKQELRVTQAQAAEATQMAQLARDIASGNMRNEEVRRVTIYFDHSSSAVTEEAQKMVDGIVEELMANPDMGACIIGYADGSGDPTFNDWLASRRAEKVRQNLVSRLGNDFLRVASIGLGTSRPIADNESIDGRRQNRRVEISLVRPQLENQLTQSNQ